jgi:hypothetical protein
MAPRDCINTLMTEAYEPAVTAFANQMPIALENARLHQETQQRLREVGLLYRVGATVVSTLDLDKRLQLIVDSAVKAVPVAQKGSLHLLDEGMSELVMRAGCGFSREVMEAATFKIGEGYAGWAVAHKKPVIIDEALEVTRIYSVSGLLPPEPPLRPFLCNTTGGHPSRSPGFSCATPTCAGG